MKISEFMPYISSIFCAFISGIITYISARKQCKNDIMKIEKQHELDIEKEREKFGMEKEKIELEYKHQIELLQIEMQNNIGNTIITEVMKTPSVKQQLTQGVRSKSKKK